MPNAPMPNAPMPNAPIPSFRAATAADAPLARAISRAAYAKWVPLIGREPWPMTADYEAAIRNHRIDLLHLEGEAIALVELIPQPDHLLIENVAVLPDHQGRGHGRRLMHHAEAVAATLGLRLLRLYTNQRFAENIALYTRLGYAIDRTETVPAGTVVHMCRSI
jgi:GNAT superfamily N-acetyltransferase